MSAGHPFPNSALVDEIFFQPPNLLIDQIVGLMNQTKRDVGYNFWRTGFFFRAAEGSWSRRQES